MPNYQEGKIYKIYNTISDDIYIGSTTQALSRRMAEHRINHKNKQLNTPIYEAFNKYGVKNFFIQLVEKYPCDDKEELHKKEGEYVRNLNPSLNSEVPGRSLKEWREDNKEHVSKVYKEYYILVDKDRKSERVTCECGRVLSRGCLSRHKRSNIHLNNQKK